MLSIVRTGPECLILNVSDKIREIEALLARWGAYVNVDQESALTIYGGNRRLVFFSISKEVPETLNPTSTYVSENSLNLLLATLINEKLVSGVETVKILPGSLIMRLLGDIDKGIKEIQEDLGGEVIHKNPTYRSYIPSTSTVVYFTNKSLNKTVSHDDIHEKALLIHDRSKGAIQQFLTRRGVEYMGDALGTPDWNDIEIKIYDADGFFAIHRSRLWAVIQGLQAGMVLEENWSKDQAFTLMSVPAYLVRIITPLDVREIKEIAMGLEYNEEGNRFADFDVYHKGKKISSQKALEEQPGVTRNQLGMLFRNEIIKNLDFDSRNELLALETTIKEKTKKGI
jgi:hypothetical protein